MRTSTKCPRCNRDSKGKGAVVQGVSFGPHCSEVVYRRQRIRESFGTSQKEIRVCSVSGREFYSKTESDNICPTAMCAHCRYNTPTCLAVLLCPLEVENKLRELERWK